MPKKSSDLVSIIIPVYNASLYLRATIDSVINQSHRNWELFLVNNCSTDGSTAIIDDYCSKDSRIRRLDTEFNTGSPGAPRNLGASVANGQFLAFLDSDDCWKTEKLALQLDFINETQADMVHCGAVLIDGSSNEVGELNHFKKYRRLKYLAGNHLALFLNNPIIVSSSLIRESAYIKFRENKDVGAMEDWFLWLELHLAEKKILMLNRNLLDYRVHGASLTNALGEVMSRRGFTIFTLLLVEGKIGLGKFWLVCTFQVVKILRLRFLSKLRDFIV